MDRIWQQNYPSFVPAETRVPDDTVVDRFHAICANHPAFRALSSMGASMTFGELQAQADAFTSWLQQAGVEPGERVALMLPNVMAFPVCLFGSLQGGYIVTPINPLYTPRELIHQVNDAGARVLVVFEAFAHVVEQAMPHLRVKHVIVVSLGEFTGLRAPLVNLIGRHVKHAVPSWHLPSSLRLPDVLKTAHRRRPDPVRVIPNDTAILIYTGGTTGVSKGAELTHRNLRVHEENLELWLGPFYQRPPGRIVYLTVLPLYHVSGLMNGLLPTLLHGSCCALVANPRDIDALVKTMSETRFNVTAGINTLFNALLNHPRFASINFDEVEIWAAGGAPTLPSVADRWQAVTGKPVCELYGLSEVSGCATANRFDLAAHTRTAGLPLPLIEVSIRDDTGMEVGCNTNGEVCLRGPQVMKGYWRRPEETAKAFTEDGFFRTGDIGCMDDEGFLRIVDRKKDMILVSGFNVYPLEIEEVLAAHPAVAEAAVIGLPDDRTGEAVFASVVLRAAATTEGELLEYCRRHLTAYKCPRSIRIADVLPKTPVGKILRREVRMKWSEDLSSREKQQAPILHQGRNSGSARQATGN